MNDLGTITFWQIRRYLGYNEFQAVPHVDAAIREEIETHSVEKGEVSIKRIRDKLNERA